MSSSSSDSDSDDFEPIRRIKINIKPKDTIVARDGADVEAIKASVEAWRPLGPRPPPSLTRRQSSLSSMSSLSLGTASNSIQGGSSNRTVSTVDTVSGNIDQNHCSYQPSFVATKGNTMVNNHANKSIRSSPSCSSLVNEFTNRTSFSNFMPNASRTSSPLAFMNCNSISLNETVPIALAIQESIELTVKGQHRPTFNGFNSETQFETRALGNIKIAFPNTFARLCSLDKETSKDSGLKPIPPLKLRLHSTENIIRYYASGLVKDSDSEQSGSSENINKIRNENNNNQTSDNNNHRLFSNHSSTNEQQDPFNMNESPTKFQYNNKIIEFDMASLTGHLKRLYDQSPNMRYYTVDVLRYQIAPIDKFEKCPLQVCAYWKLESKLIKLRLDFKHSNQSGFNLERLREISFIVNLDNLIPQDLSIKPVLPDQASSFIRSSTMSGKSHISNIDLENRCKDISSISGGSDSSYSLLDDCNNQISSSRTPSSTPSSSFHETGITNLIEVNPIRRDSSTSWTQHSQRPILSQPQSLLKQDNSLLQLRLPPPPSSGHSRHHHKTGIDFNNLKDTTTGLVSRTPPTMRSAQNDVLSLIPGLNEDGLNRVQTNTALSPIIQQSSSQFNNLIKSSSTAQQVSPESTNVDSTAVPYVTFEPRAIWDDQNKKLTWKFDNLLAFYKNEGSGSLLAKLDFRHCGMLPTDLLEKITFTDDNLQDQSKKPKPVDIKFMVIDSTLSKINLTVDSTGYRMSLLKKEVRSGRYKSEPCTF